MTTLKNLQRKDFLYQPYYCEENIWHLCQDEMFQHSVVIFIASKGNAFPMMNQRVMHNPSIPVYWDYHVILLVPADAMNTAQSKIIDFDTRLAFVTELNTYFGQTFLDYKLLRADERPLFRIMPARQYCELFSSDRSHMQQGGEWLAPPPQWPLIGEGKSNLSAFIDMRNDAIGEVLTYDNLLARFSC